MFHKGNYAIRYEIYSSGINYVLIAGWPTLITGWAIYLPFYLSLSGFKIEMHR